MDELIQLDENHSSAPETYMIAGWHQWADAGNISSGLPQYLIRKTGAKKVAEIASDSFYLFQLPGTHHFLRPQIKLQEGYREALSANENQFFYTETGGKGLVIFCGEEPHINAERYSSAFLDVVEALGVKRVGAVGGVYGAMPYDKDREVSCVYSLREMKKDLAEYAVRFSNYEGGTTIGTYLIDQAEKRSAEFFVFYGFVPAYDFGQLSEVLLGIRVENDFKAWYDLLKRFNHMFDLQLDLTDLERLSEEVISSMKDKLQELDTQMPELQIQEYLSDLDQEFIERPFTPLDDVWKKGLEDIFKDLDDW